MSALIQAENICKSFEKKSGSVRVLEDVSIKIEAGKTYGLAGPSGSGKTTLSSIMLNLLKPDSGRVLFKGREINSAGAAGGKGSFAGIKDNPAAKKLSSKEKKEFRRRAQIIFQNPFESLDPMMRVRDIIEEPLIIHGIGKTKEERLGLVHEMRTLTGLDPNAIERRAAELSGGQRQRVAIAAAMILRPEFVICDECVSALDVLVQAQILNLLRDFQKSFNISYLFISHNMDVVRYMSDEIFVIRDGHLHNA